MARRESPIVDEPPERTLGTRIFALVVIVVAVGIFGLVVWRAVTTEEPATSVAEVPLISADAGPARVRPDDPGGMAIPHQDKLIYQEFEGGEGEPLVERLLPPPEEPVARPRPELEAPAQLVETPTVTLPDDVDITAQPDELEPAAGGEAAEPTVAQEAEIELPTESLPAASPPPESSPAASPAPTPPPPTPVEQVTSAAADQDASVVTDQAPPAPPVETETAAVPAVVTPPDATAEAPRLEIAAQRPVPEVTTIAVPSSAYRIQLAAFRGRADAEQAWQQIQGQAPSLLGDLKPEVVRADLGADKGVFYRLRAGPIADRTAAADLCRALQAVNQDCLVVAP